MPDAYMPDTYMTVRHTLAARKKLSRCFIPHPDLRTASREGGVEIRMQEFRQHSISSIGQWLVAVEVHDIRVFRAVVGIVQKSQQMHQRAFPSP